MKKLKIFFSVVVVALLFSGCVYDFIVPVEVPVVDPDDPNAEQVLFATQIVPIFTAKCTGCHKPGGQKPDLTATNAYNALNTTRYLNSAAPEQSRIYTRPNPSNTDSHPKYSTAEAALVLLWIKQGAKNN